MALKIFWERIKCLLMMLEQFPFHMKKNCFSSSHPTKESIADNEELNVEGTALKYMEDDINKIVE